MCGRYAVEVPIEDLVSVLELPRVPDGYAPRYNVAPGTSIWVARSHEPRELELLPWSIAVGRDAKRLLVNVRDDKVLTPGLFAKLVTQERAVIPASGFYEWSGEKRGPNRVPWFIYDAANQPLFFAGVVGRDRDRRPAVAIMTTAANDTIAPLHDRMPVIVELDELHAWLHPGELDREVLARVIAKTPDVRLALHRVTTAVGDPKFEDRSAIEPDDRGETLSLFGRR